VINRLSNKVKDFDRLSPLQQARQAAKENKKELDQHAKLMQALLAEKF